MEKKMKASDKKTLYELLEKMRDNYNVYIEDECEIIDAIHMLQEELSFNIKDEEE